MLEEKQAQTIAEIWNNFDPSKVLSPESIFRVERDSADLRRPKRLLERAENNEKWFLIGHRGCGKSTFLRLLLSLEVVTEKYYPVSYRILDKVDGNDVAIEDVLFSIASQLVEVALEKKALGKKLETSLENWGRTLVETVNKEEGFDTEVTGGLSAFFAKFQVKLQSQTTTRREFRKTIEPQLSDLISFIDQICEALEQKLYKRILIAIDDMDKVRLDKAIDLFENQFTNLSKPKCHIIYTVPVAIMHKPAYSNLQGQVWYVPNIKLHFKDDRSKINPEGYSLINSFIEKRANLALINTEALETLVTYGGGVFRQTCILMQTAADYAEDASKISISLEEVQQAIAEYANGLLPQLSTQDLNTLNIIFEDNSNQLGFESLELLHNLSLLRYPNEEHWHDVNPVLWERVENHDLKNEV